jgi:uncharacterized protein (DUF488 family)
LRYAPSLSAITEILTIGHSTHQPEAFLELLHGQSVAAVADVRRFPGSRRMPWFGGEELRASLGQAGVDYLHLPELGGRRDPHADSPNGGWRVRQFQGYADHMAGAEFDAGLERLLSLAAERRTAIMCAEAQWRRCHRRLLSDAMLVRGWDVLHIGARGDTEPHHVTDFAVAVGRRLTYPPAQAALEV